MTLVTAVVKSKTTVSASTNSVTISGADGIAENTDQSYQVNVASGVTVVVPDTPISANGDLVVNQPSTIAKNLVVRYDTEGVVSTTISGGEIVVPDDRPVVPPVFIGDKAIKFDGVADRAAGWCNIVRLWDTYGFGFVINDPTSASGGVVGVANFGAVNLTTGNWNSRGAIDIWGYPNQTHFKVSTANTATNYQISNTIKGARMFFYVQVTATLIEYYINGVLVNARARTNTAPLRDTRIQLAYGEGVSTSRNCEIDTPLITDGLLTQTEITSLSAATLAQTDPTAVTSKILECWDFGQLATGVPSTDVYAPTVAYGMLANSPITMTGTFASPDGIVAI